MAPPSRRGGEMRPSLRQLPSSQTRVRDAFGFGTDFGARKEGARDRAHGRGTFRLRARRLVLDVRVPPLGCQRKELWYFAGRHGTTMGPDRSEEHTSELQSRRDLVCRLLLEKKKNTTHHRAAERHLRHLRSAADTSQLR